MQKIRMLFLWIYLPFEHMKKLQLNIKKFFSGLWKIYLLLVTAVFLIILYPFYYFWLTDERHFKKGFHLTRMHAKLILFFGGIRVKILNKQHLPFPPYVIIANHSSYLDILLLYALIDKPFVFMGKHELTRIPLFNIFFKKFNIPVDRQNSTQASLAFLRAEKMLDAGYSVVIFPEGGIPKHAPVVKRFKPGAFRLAIKKKVPIVPIVYIDNWKLLGDKQVFSLKARPGVAGVYFLPVIKPENLSEESIQNTANALIDQMNLLIKQYNSKKMKKVE